MNGMFQGEGSLASSQQGSSGIMSKPVKEESKPEKTPVSFNFQGEGGEDNNSDNTDSGTVVTNKEVDDVIAEYKLPTVLTSYNNTVKNLQTYLNNTPIAPELSTDGRWGAKTSAAVSDFQRYKNELYKTTAAETFDETGGIVSRPATANYMQDINKPLGGGLDDLFYSGIKLAEGKHGKTKAGLYTPVPTNDKREESFSDLVKSKDIGYGHKVKDLETAAKEIYGIPFINAVGDFIPLTEQQVETIYKEDMRVNLELARKSGWDKKLKDMGTTWEALPIQYKLPLTSLAYNVGGTTAGKEWTEVLRGAKNKDIQYFALHLRREDGGKYTKGMDNRVIKELKAARLISDSSEVTGVLPKASI